ncbi:MAG: DUF1611 domain-containing protein [Gammaproteobacteria bacterium]|nr:DUF1611 domain-containing protein [Gammaproteobacteria bacterium]
MDYELDAKTAFGIAHWRPELCLAQLRFGTEVDLGLPDMTPKDAVAAGAKSLIVGVAPVGGAFPETWIKSLVEAAHSGLHIVAGMHTRLDQVPGLSKAATEGGVRLIDVRKPPLHIPVGMGIKRPGRRLLTVGTDCAVGKKYTALAIEKEMHLRDMNATFRATGQTGIMIAGEGVPIDTVIADFISGAAEILSPANEANHWDVIEGQGSIVNPGYAGVTVGLMHGSQPDALVLCHEAERTEIDGWDGYNIPEMPILIDQYLVVGRLTNPAVRMVGISVNTSNLDRIEAVAYLRRLEDQMEIPCVDPLADGVGRIIDQLQRED